MMLLAGAGRGLCLRAQQWPLLGQNCMDRYGDTAWQERGVEVHEGVAVAAVRKGRLELAGGAARDFDECLWCTQAAAPAWLRKTGLPLGAPPMLMKMH